MEALSLIAGTHKQDAKDTKDTDSDTREINIIEALNLFKPWNTVYIRIQTRGRVEQCGVSRWRLLNVERQAVRVEGFFLGDSIQKVQNQMTFHPSAPRSGANHIFSMELIPRMHSLCTRNFASLPIFVYSHSSSFDIWLRPKVALHENHEIGESELIHMDLYSSISTVQYRTSMQYFFYYIIPTALITTFGGIGI
jgi:hypothetical protein